MSVPIFMVINQRVEKTVYYLILYSMFNQLMNALDDQPTLPTHGHLPVLSTVYCVNLEFVQCCFTVL